jgi:purine-nucleoside phosphorylase
MVSTPRTAKAAHDEGQLLQQAFEYVTSRSGDFALGTRPTTAIILGSGLGGLADQIAEPIALSYEDIPGFGVSSAGGHRGDLILGYLGNSQVIAMAGRFHRYEGWSNNQIAFPVKLMARLGAGKLIVSNAAGGVNPKLRVGDIVVIRDHLNFMGTCSFLGFGNFLGLGDSTQSQQVPNSNLSADQPTLGPNPGPASQAGDVQKCPSLQRAAGIYDPQMSCEAVRIGTRGGFNVYPGTYLATLGPNYETRSEYRMMRRIGADVAGMSTVPEVLAGSAAGMRILGLSMVSNVANPDQPIKADHAEVLEAGAGAAVKLESIVRGVLDLGVPDLSVQDLGMRAT